jgi:uncharacterized damage-inducible protein DinB
MNVDFLKRLYSYNHWANNETVAAVSRLDDDAFTRALGNSFSSVRDTLVHILGAEWIWLERWNGRSPRALLTSAEFPDLERITRKWKQVEDGQSEFLGMLTPLDLDKSISYVNQKGETWSYPLGQQMLHVVNHSTYHRGQVTTLLRQLGAEPAGTDFLRYYDELPQSPDRESL